MNRLREKVAIVTGAGTGIGQGIAKRLGAEGASVIVDYVGDASGAEETKAAIEQAGTDPERHYLKRRLTEITGSPD